MATESTAQSSHPVRAEKTESPSATEHLPSERRLPTAQETLQTLPDIESDLEPHDTIPAPTWLEDELMPPHKGP